jgi:hypothetical protein
MIIHLPQFLVALLLLWLPRGWLRRGVVLWRARRARSSTHSWTHAPADGTTLTPGYEFMKVRNYVDLLRAGVATIALVGSNGVPAAVTLAPGETQGATLVLGIRAAILLIAVLIQTVRWNHGRLALAAPVFFIGGLAAGVQEPLAGLGAFAIAWALVPVFPFAPSFLAVLGAVFAALNTFLVGVNLLVLATTAIFLVPVLVSLLARKPLLVYSRRSGGNH